MENVNEEYNQWVVGMSIKEFRTKGKRVHRFMHVDKFRQTKRYYFTIAFNSPQEALKKCFELNK